MVADNSILSMYSRLSVMNTTDLTLQVTTDAIYSVHGTSCNDTKDDVHVFQNPFRILHVRILFITVFVAVSAECIFGEYIDCVIPRQVSPRALIILPLHTNGI